jgi:hypothetical protein
VGVSGDRTRSACHAPPPHISGPQLPAKPSGLSILRRWLAIAGATSLAVALLTAQPNQFQLIISATSANGTPVTDVRADEVILTENGAEAAVLKIEPYRIPVRLTLAVDNSSGSRDALSHYRSGLKGLVEALPGEVDVTLITTSPQPRVVVGPTTGRQQILRAINGFAPEEANPRFTDTIVEFSRRLEEEIREKRVPDSLPILVMVSTTANDQMSYQVPEIEKALNFLVTRRARLMVTMTSTHGAVGDPNASRQAIIAIPAVKATRGRYEALAASSRLATLLPEIGREIAALHRRHVNQFRVTVERANGATGPFRRLQVELARPGLQGTVSVDGLP